MRDAVDHRNVDGLALAGAARLDGCGEQADGQIEGASPEIGDEIERGRRRMVWLARLRGVLAQRSGDDRESRRRWLKSQDAPLLGPSIGGSTSLVLLKPRGSRPSMAALTSSGARKASDKVIRIDRSLLRSRAASVAMDARGDVLVRPSGRHAPHHGEGLFGRAAAMLAGLRLAHPQLRMLATSPMDRQDSSPSAICFSSFSTATGPKQPYADYNHQVGWAVHAQPRRVDR